MNKKYFRQEKKKRFRGLVSTKITLKDGPVRTHMQRIGW